MHTYTSLAIDNADQLIFGKAPNPVRATPHITIGGGRTIPELNYILPYGTEVSERTLDDVVALYRRMAQGSLQRAVDLGIEEVVIEIELVFELTLKKEAVPSADQEGAQITVAWE